MSAQDSSESPPDFQDHDHDQEQDQEGANEPPTKRQKRSRACQACRAMKIRCLPVEGQSACRACGKVNRACVMPGPPRKRQKTVHKVAELEKKIDALTASLAAKANAVTSPTPPTTSSPATTSTPSVKFQPPAPRPDKEYSYDTVIENHYPTEFNETRPLAADLALETANDEYEDVITRKVMDEATVDNVYQYWRRNMCPCSPIVAFAEDVTIAWLRRKRPITLLAILVAAGGIVTPDLQPELAVELARILADRVMFVNEKSLDLVHAMLVYSTWYGKHKFAKDLGFNHYIHSAVAMCLDLGLGKRSRQKNYTDPQDAELRRTWLACYFMAGNVATVLRLPPLVKYSPYIEECLESFVKHPGALPSDAFLCCLAKLTHLMEDVGVLFHMDDPGSSIPLNDSRTQYSLKGFEHRLKEWKECTEPHLPEAALNHYEATASLYIHEIALHNEHNVDDFRPMYRTTGRETQEVHAKDFLTHAHFEALAICVDSMERAMHSFAKIDHLFLRHASSMHIVWTAYVSVAMIRLYGILALPDSKYGSIFLPKLDVGKCLDQCIRKLEMVLSDNFHLPAESFVLAFKKLKAWHVHRTTQQTNTSKPGQGDSSAAKMNPSDLYCGANAPLDTMDKPQNSSLSQQQQQRPPHHYPRLGQPYGQAQQAEQQQQQQQVPFTPLAANSTLLDPNTAIDASTFDIQNWDFSVGELNNFENYLNDAGWMGYLM